MSRRLKITICCIVAVVLITGALFLAKYLKSVNDYQEKVASISLNDIDIKSIPDGTYVGGCDVDFIFVRAEVEVRKGEIVNIKLLEHKNDRGQIAETVVDWIIEKQSINVDTVSMATNSSRVIMKAVENALTNWDR